MRIVLILACMLCSCAHKGLNPTYQGVMTYPKTQVSMESGLVLVHQAGKACEDGDESRPMVGSADGDRTYSEWQLLTRDGVLLGTAPSFFSDPDDDVAEGFGSYYKENDRVTVCESESGNTILVVEDRSPTFPRRAYLMMQRDRDGLGWRSREIRVDAKLPKGMDMERSKGALDLVYPVPSALSDEKLGLSDGSGDMRWVGVD